MLYVYRRHRKLCEFKGTPELKSCRCLLWAKGTIEGNPYQRSLKTRNFERAQTLVRNLEHGDQPQQSKTLEDALKTWVADGEARDLTPNTLAKYRRLAHAFVQFAGSGIHLSTCDPGAFRNSWKFAPRTAAKTLERLRSFFGFCVEKGWLRSNPAKSLKSAKAKPSPTLPFSDKEITRIFQAARSHQRAHTFFKVLLHTGLRIIDAAQLRPEKIIDGKLFLYTQKTGTPVFIPLPPDLLQNLAKLPLVGGFYFAVESDNPATIAEYYRVRLELAAIAAGLMEKKKKGEPRRKKAIHPHRFRDTFACNLLLKGVPIETVSILLGHTNLKTTMESYAPWIQGRQEMLETAVRKTWEKPKLVRVK